MKLEKARLFIENFFTSIAKGNSNDAGKLIKAIRSLYQESNNEFIAGYLQALEGMLRALKPDPPLKSSLVLHQLLNQKSFDEVVKFKDRLISKTISAVRDEYDRGFFQAWVDFIRFLSTK